MFKVDKYFECCGIFNETLVKRFEENFDPQSSSRFWITPGHIVFTNNNTNIRTCDARPYDFSVSPSEVDTDELLVTVSPILDVFFDTESASTRMFIVLHNGDVQIFEYRTLLFEWARIGYFNLNIASPNSNNNHIIVSKVLISFQQNTIYWSEKSGSSSTCFDLHKREIPLNGVREITQSSIGVPHKVLKNCACFELSEIRDNICVLLHLPNSVNVYIILSVRSHAWLFHIDGKLMWRGVTGDSPIDFISLCTKTIGLWHPTGTAQICKVLNAFKTHTYILHDNVLLTIAPNGEIQKKITVTVSAENLKECFVLLTYLCSFTNDAFLHIHDIKDGQILQSFNLEQYGPINSFWSLSSSIPMIGFSSKKIIHKLNYKPLNLLICEPPCAIPMLANLKLEYVHVFSILRDLLHHNFKISDVQNFKGIPHSIQSEALLFAVLQSCQENGFELDRFPFLCVNDVFSSGKRSNLQETKLKEVLDLIAECYIKLEQYRTISNQS